MGIKLIDNFVRFGDDMDMFEFATASIEVKSNVALKVGDGNDAAGTTGHGYGLIEHTTDDDFLTISGSWQGVVLSGSNVAVSNTLTVAGNIAGDGDEAKTIFAQSTSGGSTITLGGGGKVIAAGDLQVNGTAIDVDGASALTIGATVGANNLTLGAAASTVIAAGTLQVNGNITGDADEAKVIFAASTSGGSTITLGGGGKVIAAGDLQVNGTAIDVDGASALAIGATVGANNLTLGASTSTVIAAGTLQVNGNITGDADESKAIFAASTSAGSTITLGGGGKVITGGDLQVNGTAIDVDGASALTIGATVGANNLTLGASTSTVIVAGNLTVNGTTTQVDTTNLQVKDKNILINDGGGASSAAGAGLDIEEDGSVTGYIRVADDDRANLDLKAPGGSELKLDVNATSTITVGANLTIEGASTVNQDLTTDANVEFNRVTADGGLIADNLTLDGTSLSLSSGDFTLDVAGDITLDADGGDMYFADGGTNVGRFLNSSNKFILEPQQSYMGVAVPHSNKAFFIGSGSATTGQSAGIPSVMFVPDDTIHSPGEASWGNSTVHQMIHKGGKIIFGQDNSTASTSKNLHSGSIRWQSDADDYANRNTHTGTTGAMVLSSSLGFQMSGSASDLLILAAGKNVKAGGYVTHSDRNLKCNIKPMSNALSKVMKLEGVNFDWKHDGAKDFGFIAQQMADIVPEACAFDGNGISRGVDYSRITALLTEAIKDQQKQIVELKKALNKEDK